MINNLIIPSSKNRKYLLLIPVVLMLLAVIVGVIFKFNVNADFKTTYTFNVVYNSSIEENKYADYENEIAKVLQDNNIKSFDFEKLNEDISLATKVNIYNSDMSFTELKNIFNKASSSIETNINNKIGNGHINISDLYKVSGQSFTNQILNMSLVLLVFAIIFFAYTWIRHEFKMAISSLFILPYNIGILLALTLIFRLPVNNMFTIPFYLSTLIAYLIFVIIADKIRENINNENYSENNSEIILQNAVAENKKIITNLIIVLSIAILLSMLTLSLKVFFVSILCLLGVISAIYSAVCVAYAIWSKIYNKANDKKLKAKKLKKEQPKTKKSKQEDKVVV